LRPKNWTDPSWKLTDQQRITIYLREGRMVEVMTAPDGSLQAFQVDTDSGRSSRTVDLNRFFKNESIANLQRNLRNDRVKRSPLAIRIILGEDMRVFQTARAVCFGEAWLHGRGI